MKLSEQAIAEFRELHRKHYSYDLTDDEAEREAAALITLVAALQPRAHLFQGVVENTATQATHDISVE